jgi:hypothetical protein
MPGFREPHKSEQPGCLWVVVWAMPLVLSCILLAVLVHFLTRR